MPLLTLVQHLIRNAEEEKELAFDFSNCIIAMNRTERASLVSLMTTECQAILANCNYLWNSYRSHD